MSGDVDTVDANQGAPSWNSSRAPSECREDLEREGGAEGDPGAYESDYASEADEGVAAEEE